MDYQGRGFVRLSLNLKIFMVLLGTVLAASVVLGTLFYQAEREDLLADTSERALALGDTVQTMLATAMLTSSSQSVGQIMTGFQALDEVVGITIFDANGEPSFGTARRVVESDAVGFNEAWVADGLELDTEEGRVYRILRAIDVEPACFRCHTQTAPITGIIQVDLDLQHEYETLTAHRDRFILQAAVLGMVLILALWLALSRIVASPLRVFAERARSVARGDFSQRISVRRRDEIGDLALSFNTMTQELQTRLHEVEDTRLRLETSIHRVGEALSSALDIGGIMNVLISEAAAAGMFDAGVVLLDDGSVFAFEDADVVGRSEAVGESSLPERLESLIGAAVGAAGPEASATGEGLVGVVAESDADAPEFATLVLLSLSSEGEVMGHLLLVSENRVELDESQRRTLEYLTTQAARAVSLSRLHARTREMAITDGLTGLYDHRHFYERLELEMMRATRHDLPLSLVLLDVDEFKRYNDHVGHRGGDYALRRLGVIIRETTRVTDVSARYGGEEFVVILPHTERPEAMAFAERLREKIEAEPFESEGVQPGGQLTVSVGVACRPAHGTTVEAIVEAADAALFKAKATGRNRVAYADAHPQRPLDASVLVGDASNRQFDRGAA